MMPIKSFFETGYHLKGNPFPGNATYAEDTQSIYLPEVFGPQRDEFMSKFILAPLQSGQPMIGAVWSVAPGDPKSRGFGKSTLMGEEAKQINRDFGRSTLLALGVPEEEAQENPILAAYVSFNAKAQGGISNIDSAAFHLVRFVLRGSGQDTSTHARLREMAAARLVNDGKATSGREREALVEAMKDRFRRLAVTLDIRNLLEDFVFHLAGTDADALEKFMAEVGTWHHDRNGLKYLQLFVAFAELAGIQHLTFFIDQVEDFTSNAGAAKIQKNVKIIRDALIEAEPFCSRASFVFQLHPDAYERLRDAWDHEDLRSLEWDDPLNETVVVVLKGLEVFDQARLLAEHCLNHPCFALPGRAGGVTPFTEDALRRVWEATRPRPRDYLKVLNALLQQGQMARAITIDETFVSPRLERFANQADRNGDDASDNSEDDRLA